MASSGPPLAETGHDHGRRPQPGRAAQTLTASERDWLAVRAYLTGHRYELAVGAAEDYPPDRRVAGTPLLAAPGWASRPGSRPG